MNFRFNWDKHLSSLQQLNKRTLIFGSLGILSIISLTKMIKQLKLKTYYKNIYTQKRKQLLSDIQRYQNNNVQTTGLSEEFEQQILNSSIKDIQLILYNKQASVQQVLKVFINRTLKMALSDNLNLVTDVNFEEALNEAKLQDQEIENNKEIIFKYELFGIPISVKENITQKGFDCTLGIADNCFKPQQEDGLFISMIRKARGLIFVRSNVPQMLLAPESHNFIFGRSLNPWNKDRSVGGSSGGEAALQAARCAVVSLSTDLAGSIRIPAAFCGVYGFKAGSYRSSSLGQVPVSKSQGGMLNIRSIKGPIARCVDDLIVVSKALLNTKYYNDLPFHIKDPFWKLDELQELPTKKLKIGYITHFSQFIPPNCIIRGVYEAGNALALQGHQIYRINLDSKLEDRLVGWFLKFIRAEKGLQSFNAALKNEQPINEYKTIKMSAKIPQFINKYLLTPLLKLFHQDSLSYMLDRTRGMDVYQFLVHSYEQKQLQLEFFQYLKQLDIDALIVPGFGTPAFKHGTSQDFTLAALYAWIWNTLDVPVGTMPISIIQEGQDLSINQQQHKYDKLYKKLKEQLNGAQGLPINVQIISFPHNEELVLKVMKDIEQEIQFNKKYPYPN